jgi:23S rRNA-/tRNA-specific pseudouridylate synthase
MGKPSDAKPSHAAILPRDAETHFQVLQTFRDTALIEARPTTGRTHQIRVHLAASGHPVVGDPLYGIDKAAASKGRQRLALRAVKLAFHDPFQKRRIYIEAPVQDFLREYGFAPPSQTSQPRSAVGDSPTPLPSPNPKKTDRS